jgi:hypothetical protein
MRSSPPILARLAGDGWRKRVFKKFFAPRGPDQPKEPQLTLARSMEELKLRQQMNSDLWGLGDCKRWDVDLSEGRISFVAQDDRLITAPVQVIGTYNTTDGSWLWGWDHPSVSAPLARAAGLARDFGDKYGLDRLTTRKLDCDEGEAWSFTALAMHLAQEQGAYRGPAGTTLVFMTFGTVTLSKPS